MCHRLIVVRAIHRIVSAHESSGQRGVALIGTVLAVLILSMVGMVSVKVTLQEVENANVARDATVAKHLAEAGVDLITQWFHDPSAAPSGSAGAMFLKRFDLPGVGASFFDGHGKSQFMGTADRPDILLDASRSGDDRLLHDPSNGWFRALRRLGQIRKIKVYAPSRPGLLCTVEVTVLAGSVTKTLSLQLTANHVPPLRSPVQLGVTEANRMSDAPLPLWAHWGELLVKGDVRLATRQEIPVKTSVAVLSGQSYADMIRREDRWLELKVGGEVAFLETGANGVSPSAPMPPNVYTNQEPVPGLNLDRWDYDMMKKQALKHGVYYTMDRSGLLYKNGKVGPGLGLSSDRIFNGAFGEPFRGFIFVDTLDQRAPGSDNLGTMFIEPAYLEGLFVINAHVHLKPKGAGRAVAALGPPSGETSDETAEGKPIQLGGIHVNGVLYAAGNLVFDGAPRVYGAVLSGGTLTPAASTSGPLEVWYDYDLHSGLIRGLPLVSVASGTEQELF